jgi:2,3-dihydroxyphenylpropionate 1,2-dioxygenase
VPLLAGAPDEIANFLIAGRNPTPEARAARQARTIAAGKIYGTPHAPETPSTPNGTGLHGPAGRRPPRRDRRLPDRRISKAAGRSTHEIRTWVAAFAALAAIGPTPPARTTTAPSTNGSPATA